MKGDWLTVKQIAEALQVSHDKVTRWIDRGQLPAINVTADPNPKRREWRVKIADFEHFLEARVHRPRERAEKPPPRRKRTYRSYF